MQNMPNQTMMGQHLAVMGSSRYRQEYVPLDDAVLYSMFPDPVPRRGGVAMTQRLACVRLSRTNGKVVGCCTKWWDLDALRKRWRERPNVSTAKAVSSSAKLQAALQQEGRYVSPFGEDLPIYIDSASSRSRDLDWEMLELDVFRGLNGQVPFDYRLSRRVRGRIIDELPFIDIGEHFRTVVPDDTYRSLTRQLIDQHTRVVNGMSLVPLRWVKRIGMADTVVVETDVPIVIRLASPKHIVIELGAMVR
jgi:hypothetical protein